MMRSFSKPKSWVPVALILALTAGGLAQPVLGLLAAQGRLGAAPAVPFTPASELEVLDGVVCPPGAKLTQYNVTSLPIPISYNHWGDFDPKGRIFIPESLRDPMLSDVGDKLAQAGLGTLAAPVLAMRDAFRVGDIPAAVDAAADLAAAAAGLTPQANALQDRYDVSDYVEPLVLRAHVGDCVKVNLLNVMSEPTSIHVHAVRAPPGQGTALGSQEPDYAKTGLTRLYTMYIPDWPGMEGAHFLHSHADSRDQTRHGMFGAVVAEPKGSTWLLSSDTSKESPHHIAAIIDMPDGQSDFREFVQIYHDEIDAIDWQLQAMPTVAFDIYGPNSKGINLRSEPFYERFRFHDAANAVPNEANDVRRNHDKSQSYGSYTYGDPATRFERSYLGDPVKFRYINAGPGQAHIHHLHGGGIRWKTTPLAEPSQFDIGMVKTGNQVASASQRLDVQNANPGESFTLEPEGGTGGVQASVGDFLYHCHIAEHYLAGMWSFWRSYNTLQPDLAQLPDRDGVAGKQRMAGVTSVELLGRTVQGGTTLTTSNIRGWVEAMLPARGVPGEEDSSVWNWAIQETPLGPLYKGEPEDEFVWPNFKADHPGRVAAGERPALLFDPITGKLAYPHLRPHFGERPPFAPNHGPAPYLGNDVTASNPDGLCPSANVSQRRLYNVTANETTLKYNKFDKDPHGQVLVLNEDRAGLTAPDAKPTSIVLRANTGDCVDVLFTNTLHEKDAATGRLGIHSKTNIHIHLVQFDVQASDGVVAGFNYETTLRTVDGRSVANTVRDPSAPVMTKIASGGIGIGGGETIIPVKDIRVFRDATGAAKKDSTVGIGHGGLNFESAKLKDAVQTGPGGHTQNGDWRGFIVLDRELKLEHAETDPIGYEFVRYRWYADVELGTVFFHDHVNGIDTWRRGLFGSLIVEPPNSRWLPPNRANDDVPDDPTAHVVDIVPGDGKDAYREAVLHFQDRGCVLETDDDCLNHGTPAPPDRETEPAAFNLKSEPLHRRNAESPFWDEASLAVNEPETPFDDTQAAQGPPGTDMIEAYPGDKVVIRFLYTGQSDSRGVGTFGVTGHRFRAEQYLEGSRTTDAISVAISSQHNLQLECGAGSCRGLPGDYMYMMTQPDYLDRGAWGLIRVYDPAVETPIALLEDNPAPQAGTLPAQTPKYFDVAAVETTVFNNPVFGITSTTRRFVPLVDAANAIAQPAIVPPAPYVVRVSPGDLIQVNLTNLLPAGSQRVGMHASMLVAGPAGQGFNVGRGPQQTAAPGQTIRYQWYADREIGVVDLVSLATVADADRGLTGALVVEPLNAQFSPAVGPSATVTLAGGKVFREHVLLFSSQDGQFESTTMPYNPDVLGITAINYATEPLHRRAGFQLFTGPGAVGGAGLSTCQIDGDNCLNRPFDVRNPLLPFAMTGMSPLTPILDVQADQGLVIRFVGAAGDQLRTMHLDGHVFAADPDMDDCRLDFTTCRSNLISDAVFGPREVRNAWIPAVGEGGVGDYLYRDHRDAFFEAGAWGILRVR